MQQMNSLRKRLGGGGQWFRIGLASATVVTPLVTRWNDLRAAERARALADEAEARLRAARARVIWPPQSKRAQSEALEMVQEVSTQMGRNRGKVSTNVWLVGVGVGLVAAGTGAYVIVRRKMAQAMEEPLVDLPTASKNGHSAQVHEAARGITRDGANNTNNATSTDSTDNTNGTTAATPTPTANATTNATTNAANRSATAAPAPAAVPAPTTPIANPPASTAGTSANPTTAATPPTATPAITTPVSAAPGELPGGATTITEDGAPAGVMDAEAAPFIGNIRTMVYHEAGADNLPAEENRIYFASEDEARDAGYRRDRDEVAGGETQTAGEAPGGVGA